MTFEIFLIAIACILIFCVVSSKVMVRFGVPVLLLFMVLGLFLGETTAGRQFMQPDLVQKTGLVALNLILFSGGLSSRWRSLRPVAAPGIVLASAGTILTALITGCFCVLALRVSWLEGMLIGSVVGSTDAASVFSVLRSKNINLRNNLAPLLELESGANDPIAYLMASVFLSLLASGGVSVGGILLSVAQQLLVGAGLGVLFGLFAGKILNRLRLSSDGLYLIFVLGLVVLLFAGADVLGGNSFLASYLFAILLGNSQFVKKLSTVKFFEALSWLSQIILFILLGVQVVPASLLGVTLPGLGIALAMVLVCRPLVVFALLAFFKKFDARDKAFVSWVGFRGGSSIVFAAFTLSVLDPALSGIVFNVVFFICLTSILVQGTLTPLTARLLRVRAPDQTALTLKSFNDYVDDRHSVLAEMTVAPRSFAVGKSIIDLELPRNILIIMIYRQGGFITPTGQTLIRAGDVLTVTANTEGELELVSVMLGREGIPDYEGEAADMEPDQRAAEGIDERLRTVLRAAIAERQTQLTDEAEDGCESVEIPTYEEIVAKKARKAKRRGRK